MYLVIAEKPSVSNSIAKVLGAYQKKDGYLEGRDCIVSWCLGHLAEYVNEIDPITGKPLIYFIKRDRVPEKMWCFDEAGNRCEWEKQ